MKSTKRVLGIILTVSILLCLLPQSAFAAQSRTQNFSKNYTLTGNPADDIVAVAMAQLGKHESELGYTEPWCADFVGDCAKLIGQSDAIPMNAYVPTFYKSIINAGGYVVSSPKKGDIIFYLCPYCDTDGDGISYEHVGIVIDSTYSVEGNYNDRVSKASSYKDGRGHTTASGTIRRVYIRPAYKTNHTHDFSGQRSYEIEHPHAISQRCTAYDTCGGWTWTNDYYTDRECPQCWNVNLSLSKTSATVNVNETITLNTSFSGVYPESAVLDIVYDESVIKYTLNNGELKITGLKKGSTDFTIKIYSDSSFSTLLASATVRITVALKNHTHEYSGQRIYEIEHPHAISQRCKDYDICGGWTWTDDYHTVRECPQCWDVNLSLSKTNATVYINNTVTLNTSFSGVYPESAVLDIVYDESVIKYTLNNGELKITGLKAGKTDITLYIYSDDSHATLLASATAKITVESKDTTKPITMMSITNNQKPSQTVTLYLSDDVAVASYYWGKSSSPSADSFTAFSSTWPTVEKTVTEAGTYYLFAKDTSGNVSDVRSITFYKTEFNANGGTISPSVILTQQNASFIIPAPNRYGYRFIGWASSASATTATYLVGIPYKPTANKTLYAIWERIPNPISPNPSKPIGPAPLALGDINGDKEVTTADARLALRKSVGLEDLTTLQIIAADIDGNGIVEVSDARIILRVSVGLDSFDKSKTETAS